MLLKKTQRIFFTIISVNFALFGNKLFAANDLKIITCECPPLSYEVNAKASGPAVDIVRTIQKSINSNEKINIYPWAQGYKQLQSYSNVMLFSTTRTAQREHLFKWVGPIIEKRFSFHAKKGAKIKIDNLEDAKKYKVGVVRNSNNEQFLVSNGFKNLSVVAKESQNLQMLELGRIDLWYTDTAQCSALMTNYSLKEKIEEIYVVQKSRSYYAFSIITPDSIVEKWQNAFTHLRNTGVICNILKKYKLESLYAD